MSTIITPKVKPTRDMSVDCIHLGTAQGNTDEHGNIRACRGCWVFGCDLHQTCCITYERKDAARCCRTCQDFQPEVDVAEAAKAAEKPQAEKGNASVG